MKRLAGFPVDVAVESIIGVVYLTAEDAKGPTKVESTEEICIAVNATLS